MAWSSWQYIARPSSASHTQHMFHYPIERYQLTEFLQPSTTPFFFSPFSRHHAVQRSIWTGGLAQAGWLACKSNHAHTHTHLVWADKVTMAHDKSARGIYFLCHSRTRTEKKTQKKEVTHKTVSLRRAWLVLAVLVRAAVRPLGAAARHAPCRASLFFPLHSLLVTYFWSLRTGWTPFSRSDRPKTAAAKPAARLPPASCCFPPSR